MVDLGTTQGIPSWLNLSGLKAPSSSPALTSRSGLFSAASPAASTKGGKCESGAMKNQKMAGGSQGVCYTWMSQEVGLKG